MRGRPALRAGPVLRTGSAACGGARPRAFAAPPNFYKKKRRPKGQRIKA
ncbi:MAG: hypothetical protein IKK29_03395 [Christensenellaceae bacterium]|nr:hypothetical protein [Christensenellaceae bacterium]